MLCCVGLIGGLAVGQYLGGPWTFIAPATGFGAGLVGDMKFMHKMRCCSPKKDEEKEGHNKHSGKDLSGEKEKKGIGSGSDNEAKRENNND